MIELSIIIPVYNVENYIRTCVKSALQQELQNIEIILVDDGSTDESGHICDEFALEDHRIQVIHSENHGPGIARNLGLEIANGRYITFLDSDDYLDMDYYGTMLDVLKKNECDIVQGDYWSFTDEGKKYVNSHDAIHVKGYEKCLLAFLEKKHVDNYLWNKIFRKELLTNVSFPPLYYSEDQCFLLQIFAKASSFINCCNNHYYHRIQENSLCKSKFSIRKMDVFKAITFMEEFLSSKNRDLNYIFSIDACSYAARYHAYANDDLKEQLQSIFQNYYPEYKKNCRHTCSFRKNVLLALFHYIPRLSDFIVKRLHL